MEKITLANGTEIENAHCIRVDEKLFVYIENMDIRRGFELFIEPANTSVITEESYGKTKEYKRFTKFSSISDEYGNCNIVLKRENED